MTKLLRIETDYFVAAAVYEKGFAGWRCVEAAPIVRWLLKKSPQQAKIDLLKMGAKTQWISQEKSPNSSKHSEAGNPTPLRDAALTPGSSQSPGVVPTRDCIHPGGAVSGKKSLA